MKVAKKSIENFTQQQLDKLIQDNEDMGNSHCTGFERCKKCGRLSDEGYCCFYCGNDNSSGG